MNLDVILEAKYIPDNSIVRKISGTSEYTLRSNLVIWSDDPKNKQVVKTDGCKFLVSSLGAIICIPENKKFIYETTLEDLNCILKGEDDEDDDEES